jgi:hypothetical protein
VQLELLNSVHHSSGSKLSLSLSHIHVLQVGGWVNFDILETDYGFLPSEDFTVSCGVIMYVLMLWFFFLCVCVAACQRNGVNVKFSFAVTVKVLGVF